MNNSTGILTIFSGGKALLLGLCLILGATSAFALDLHDAKNRGLVGETVSGYLAVVSSHPDADALVKDINAKRKAEYERIARQNGIAVSDVEALAGKKAIEKTPAGHYVNVDGRWIKR